MKGHHKLILTCKRIVVGLSIVFAFCQSTFADIYYVTVNGNDASGNGSANNPWKTLKHASVNVPAGQGHVIQVGPGTFVENGPIEIPLGVSIEGAGVQQTIFKAVSSFYYYPANPGYGTEHFLIRLSEFNPSNGNQTLKNFTINGDSKKLHGGIYVRYRDNVLIENVSVQDTNYTGIWLWDVKDSRIKNVFLLNCSWGSTGYSSGALNLGNLERVEIDQLDVNEDTGYGIKAIGPNGYNNLFYLKIHHSHISVNPEGLWSGGRAPNISIELWLVGLLGCEIYNSYVDNNISLVNANAIPSNGMQTIRVHHNIIDLDSRANGSGYGIELTVHDAEVDHNYFIKGAYGIVNWDNPMQNWNIHHNVFYGQQGQYPGEIVRSQWSGLQNVKLFNNTVEFIGDKTMSLIGLYGGTSNNLEIRNNLVINSSTGYNFFPHEVIHTENGAAINNLTILKNSTDNLELGSLLESLLTILGIIVWTPEINLSPLPNPSINQTGNRPEPYYFPNSGSSLIDGGTDVGFPFLGAAPDIGAFEFGATPTPNAPPWVNLNNPVNNSVFATGAAIQFNVDASDSDGTINKVEFFNGSTKLGEDLTSPYSFTWSNVQAGAYTLTAKATDNASAATTSTAVNVTVSNPNNPPTVTITNPTNNSSFTAGSDIVLTANASDSDGTINKVEFFNGSTKLGEDLTSPYSFTWSNVQAGAYTLTAKATDNASAATTSTAVNVTVSNPNNPPTVTITNPTNNSSFTAGSDIVLTANASDSDGTISKVEFFSGSTKLGEDLISPYSFTWSNVQAGAYTLTAKATDNASAATTSTAVNVTVSNPNNPPTVTITNPTNNSSFTAGSNIVIAVNASDSDGTVSKVEFFSGSTKLGEDLTSPYSFTWSNVQAGAYTLTAMATDNISAVATSTAITLTVNPNSPPTVAIANPANNTSFTAGSNIVITANASDSDGTISKVEFFNGSTKLGETSTGPFNYDWFNVPPGEYSLTATATDDKNLTTTSMAVVIIVVDPNAYPLSIYPNPASEKFTVQYYTMIPQQVLVKMADVNSRLIICQTLLIEEGFAKLEVDVHHVAPAVYIVSLETDNGRKFSRRLIVVH